MISQHTANDCPRLPPARQQGPAPVCNFPSPSAIMTVMPNKFIFFNTSSRLQIKSALHPHPISLSDNDGWWPSPFIASTCISLPICLTTQIHRQLYSVPLSFPAPQTLALLSFPIFKQASIFPPSRMHSAFHHLVRAPNISLLSLSLSVARPCC